MGTIRYSKQRERILELLRQTDAHPTANWLYDQLKQEFPNLSMGTVYRNLNILHEQGLVEKIAFGSTFDRFEATMHPHYHFICDECGAIIDLDVSIDSCLDGIVSHMTGLTPTRHRIEFFGKCDRCK